MIFNTIIEDKSVEIEFSESLDQLLIKPNFMLKIDCMQLSSNSYSLILNGKSHYITINKQINGYEVTVDHQTHLVQVQDEVDILLEKLGMKSDTSIYTGEIHALIPGLVSRLFVKPGDKVEIGQKLLILEAMKMENEIDSPICGTVHQIHFQEGDNVEKGTFIMKILN